MILVFINDELDDDILGKQYLSLWEKQFGTAKKCSVCDCLEDNLFGKRIVKDLQRDKIFIIPLCEIHKEQRKKLINVYENTEFYEC